MYYNNIKMNVPSKLTEDEKQHIKQLMTTYRSSMKVGKGDAGMGRKGSNDIDTNLDSNDQTIVISPRGKSSIALILDYVIDDCCVCVERECNITNMKKYAPTFYADFIEKKTQDDVGLRRRCSVITDTVVTTKRFQDIDHTVILDRIIEIFQTAGLLRYNDVISRYYLLNGNKKLSWKNIKQLDIKYVVPFISAFPETYAEVYKIFNDSPPSGWDVSNFVMYVKYLFWYFRKAMVDTTTRSILNDTQVTAVSVGSTNVDSDYDITLYGDNHNIFKTINAFNTKLVDLFNADPDVVFDTNMYGVSFIKSGSDYQCGSNSFSLVKSLKNLSNDSVVLQNVWAIIKVVAKLNEIQKSDEGLHELLFNTLQNTNNTNFVMILQIAEMFVNRYEPSHDLYDKMVRAIETIDAESEEYLNFISFVNYNGLETYFTMGAFINVVVNGQMCKDPNALSKERVPLSIHEYYDSIVENLADLMVHYNKEKYLSRAKLGLLSLAAKLSSDSLERINSVLKSLNQIESLQNQCKRVDTLIYCSKFMLMNTCMQCIKEVSEVYFDQLDNGLVDKGLEKFETYLAKFPTRGELEGMMLTGSLNELISRLSPEKK